MRRPSGTPVIEEVILHLDPPLKSLAWREPVRLTFSAICWSHGEDAAIAYIPALGIEVPARNLTELHKLIPTHIKAHLLRTKTASSLERLTWLQRSRMIILNESSLTAFIRTPKQIAAELGTEDHKRSVLEEVATDLAHPSPAKAFEIDDLVATIASLLTGRNARSVLLVGHREWERTPPSTSL